MHQLHRIIKEINRTHRGLGPFVAFNLLASKAHKTILNISPAGCGKSAATNVVYNSLSGNVQRYGSVTLAGLHSLQDKLRNSTSHIIIDDLAAEKSIWARVATISTLSHLVYSHEISKYTQSLQIKIENFSGSCALNIQPVLMQSLVDSDDWVSMVRDKVIRYYHLVRPAKPQSLPPQVKIAYGKSIDNVHLGKFKGKLYYGLLKRGLYQWSAARCNEHIPHLLKACAALDERETVEASDYHILGKLMDGFCLEVQIIDTYGFESARTFNQNAYYILVEMASFPNVTLDQICVDYKVSKRTAERLLGTVSDWCYLEQGSPKIIRPTDQAKKLLEMTGVGQKW